MARSIIGTPSAAQVNIEPSYSLAPSVASLAGVKLQQKLRQRRSPRYLDAIKRIDAGSHHQDRAALDQLLKAIAEEFPELTIDQRPVGIVSHCYLGAPYVVHICDLGGNIVDHFELGRAMPPVFERARSLAMHSDYEFIEVYPDTLRAVGTDGSVSVVEK